MIRHQSLPLPPGKISDKEAAAAILFLPLCLLTWTLLIILGCLTLVAATYAVGHPTFVAGLIGLGIILRVAWLDD